MSADNVHALRDVSSDLDVVTARYRRALAEATPEEIEAAEAAFPMPLPPSRVMDSDDPTAVEESKRLATAKAKLALAGWVLMDIEGDDGAPLYCVTQWARTRCLRSIDDIESFCRLVGAR